MFGGRGCIGFDVTVEIKPVPARIRVILAFLSLRAGTRQILPSPAPHSPSSKSTLSVPSDSTAGGSLLAIGTILVGNVYMTSLTSCSRAPAS